MQMHIVMKGAKTAPRNRSSKMETMLLTPQTVMTWKRPPFQRELKMTEKVMKFALELRLPEAKGGSNGVVSGVITLGQLEGSAGVYYVLDGQHRLGGALLDIPEKEVAPLPEFIADVRIVTCNDMADMAMEYVEINQKLRTLTPDDVLKGLETTLPTLKKIRQQCPFVGYDNVRRNASSPLLSMSAAIRCWRGSHNETPTASASGQSSVEQARDMTVEEAQHMCDYLAIAYDAWGTDKNYHRLWSNLNMCMTMWLYRRLVVQRERGVRRYAVITADQFKKCLMSLTCGDYCDWLLGHVMREKDRAPCYARIKSSFVSRMKVMGITNLKMPSAEWVTG